MAETKDHPIAAFVFLAVIAGGIAAGAVAGMASAGEEQVRQEVRQAARLTDLGNYEHGIQLLEGIVERHPKHAGAIFFLANATAKAGQLEAADRLYARVLELEPHDWEAVAERAMIALKKNDVDGAIAMMMTIPVGTQGHVVQRMDDDEWWRLRSDVRLTPLLEKHRVSNDSTLRPPKEPHPD